jgi:spore coat protein U-like protein
MRGAGTMKTRLAAMLRVLCGAIIVLLCAACADAAPSCSISATGVSFSTYDVFSAVANDSTGSVTFNCTGSAHNIVITLSKGSNSTFNPRTMTGPASETLNYNLYSDAARTAIWGDGTVGTTTYANANPPNGAPVVVTIYGRIPAGQDVRTGSYSDTVTAIINF